MRALAYQRAGRPRTPAQRVSSRPLMRLVPAGADVFWIMVATNRGTAFGHRFIRNTGGSSGADVGGPWQPFRLSATIEFFSMGVDPTTVTPILTYANDTGAQNYAFARTPSVFMGSYHGGETLSGSQIIRMDGQDVDHTVARSGNSFYIQHSSTITDGTATITVTNFRTAINADGSVTYTADSIACSTALARAFIGHGMATGDVWTELGLTLAGGSTEYLMPSLRGTAGDGDILLPAITTLRHRDPTSGRSIRLASNFSTANGLKAGRLVRYGDRSKSYFNFVVSGQALGTLTNLQWTVTFETGPTGATAFGANLVTNGTFDTNLNGWTQTSGTATWGSGAANQATSTTVTNKLTQLIASLDTTAPYLFAADSSTVNGRLVLGINTNGSTTGALSDRNPVAPGRTGQVIVPTQAQLQAILQQDVNATAGLAEAWDNVSLIKLAA